MNIYQVLLTFGLVSISFLFGKHSRYIFTFFRGNFRKQDKPNLDKDRVLYSFEEELALFPGQLKSYLSLSKLGIWQYEVKTGKLKINDTFAEIIGFQSSDTITLENFLGMLSSSGDLQSLIAIFNKTLESTQEYETVVELKDRRGEGATLRVKMLKGDGPTGLPIIVGSVQKVDLSRTEVNFQENFRILVENTSDGVYIFENDYLVYVSEKLKNDFEDGFFENSKLTIENLLGFVHPEDIGTVREIVTRAKAQKLKKYKLNFRLLSRNDRVLYREDIVQYLFDDKNEIYRTIIIAKDVTELHQARQSINVEALFSLDLVDNFPGFLLVKNYDGKYIFGNKNAAKVLGVAQEEIYGLDDKSYTTDPEMILKYLEDDRKVIDTGKAMVISKEVGVRASGEEGYFQTIKIPVDIEGQAKRCVLIFAFDITEKTNQENRDLHRKNTIAYQNKILLGLSDKDFSSQTFSYNCQLLTEAISHGLKIDFASIWEIKNKELVCIDFFNLLDKSHRKIRVQDNQVWKPYFELFVDQLELVVSDTQSEDYSYLPEVSKEYFLANNIRATIDIPIKLGDDFRGVLCCEHSSVKNWSSEDIAFAKYLANIVLTLWEQEHKREAERLLLEKNEILRVTAEVSQILQDSVNFESTLELILSKIGQAIHSSRVYYFVNDLEKGSFRQIGEWVNTGVKSEMNNVLLQDLKYSKLGKYYQELLNGQTFQLKISDILDAEHADRLRSQDILSQLVIPIMPKGELLGYLGFDDCEQERTWSEHHVNSLRSIGVSIGSALKKQQSEKAKAESQQNFKQISDALEEVFWLFDIEQSKFLLISKACFDVFGVSEEEGYRDFQFIENLILEEDYIKIIERKANFDEDALKDLNYRIKTPAGQLRIINEKISPIYDENKKLVKISGIARDVTTKVESENEIRRLSVVAQNISNGVLIADLEGKVLWANQAYLSLFEVEMTDLIGRKPADVFKTHELDGPLEETNITNRPVEVKVKTYKGNSIWVELNSTLILDSNGKPSQIVEIVNNIEERKRNELTLRENESRLRFITDNTSDGFMIFRDNEIIYYSSQCEKLFGYTWSEVGMLTITEVFDFVHTEDIHVLNKAVEDIPRMLGKDIFFELRARHKNGHYFWIEVVVNVVMGDDNNPISSVVVIRNIEARKNMELALRSNKQRLNIILNSLDEVVWAREYPTLRPLFVSESIKNIYGITTNEWKLDAFDLNDFAVQEDHEIVEDLQLCLKENGYCSGTFRIKDRSGNLKWIFTSIKIVPEGNENSNMIIGILKDVTKIKEAENETQIAKHETEIAQNAYSELELRALQMQMNPHFIFNALNSIQSYIINKEEQMANVYLTKFAALIRQFLDSSRSKYISLDEEIANLKLYVELEKLRFENKFDYVFEFDPKVNKYHEIPTMLLQPFIENAINHGLRYKSSKGLLKVSFIDSDTNILVKIEDNGVGRRAAEKIKSLSSQGYKSQGLKITTHRIENYNKLNLENIKYKISDLLENSENIGTLVEIYFPKL
ncbi:MAG TPA: PAS domain S-box protein [Leadbetterella sp.]|nr:PAS domain S-box protein [Leadbetterella sp.]